MKIKVSIVQYPIERAVSEKKFFAKVESYLQQAKKENADLVVFPELIALDLVQSSLLEKKIAELSEIAKNFTPRYIQWLQERAQNFGFMILGGSVPRMTQNGIANTAVFAMPGGKTPILQDKLNLTPDERNWKWIDGSELHGIDTPFGKIVILICYDSQFASVSTLLNSMQPDLILVPSMTGPKGLNRVRWAAQARSVEHYAYTVVSGTVDPKNPKSTEDVGQAVIIPPQDGPFSTLIVEGPFNRPAIVHGSIDFSLLKESRKKAEIFSARDTIQRKASIKVNLP